jgi:putative transposase
MPSFTDNGPSYIAGAFEEYLQMHKMWHIRCSPHHPRTKGKLERFHETLKGRMNLLVWASPEKLRAAIAEFIDFCNQRRITKESATSFRRMCTTGGGKKS